MLVVKHIYECTGFLSFQAQNRNRGTRLKQSDKHIPIVGRKEQLKISLSS